MIKKYFTRKALLDYIYDTFSGSFFGFLLSMSATKMVSYFFETRSLSNLWGLKAKKALISKAAFENIEWILSIIIGFFIFEFYNKVIKSRLRALLAVGYRGGVKYLKEKEVNKKAADFRITAIQQLKGLSYEIKTKMKKE